MYSKLASMITSAAIAFTAAGAFAQQSYTPQNWPINTLPTLGQSKLTCVFNVGGAYLPWVLEEAGTPSAIQLPSAFVNDVFERYISKYRHHSNPLAVYVVRVYLKGPNEGDHWVEVGPGDYYCRDLPRGTPVSIYVQKARSMKTGWDKLCEFGVRANQRNVMLFVGANNTDRSITRQALDDLRVVATAFTGTVQDTRCEFPTGTEVTHWN